MKFPKLQFPESWSHYWSKYPEGFTILESLISWVSQVDKMTEKLNENQDTLKGKVSHQEMVDNYKLDNKGNFTGSWHGIKFPTMSEEGLRGTVEKHSEDIEEIQIELPTKVNRYDDSNANIEYYRFLAVDIGAETEDWTPAINRCLEIYDNAFIPHDIKIGSKIKFTKDNQRLEGSNRNIVIKANINFRDENLILVEDVRFPILKNFTLHGGLLKQTGEKKREGLVINNTISADLTGIIQNIFITMVNGKGLVVKGRMGDSEFTNIVIRDVMGDGVYTECADALFSTMHSGACGGDAYRISGGNNRWVNCKGWFATNGFYLTGLCARNTFVGCESQDNIINWFVGGKDCKIDTLSETSGLQAFEVGWPYTYVPDQPNIRFGSDSANNFVKIVASDRKQFITDGSFDYLVDINGTANTIIGSFRDLKKDIILNKNQLYSNVVELQGLNNNKQVKYFHYNKQLNIYDNSEHEFNNILQLPTAYDGNCEILKGGYTIKNGICYVSINVKALKTYDYPNLILQGFPKPIVGASLSIYANGKRAMMNENGQLTTGPTITVDETYYITGQYPIKNI